jgi:hypothetical protein
MLKALSLASVVLAATLGAQETRARIRLPGFKEPFPIEDIVVPFELDAPFSQAFSAIAAAFEDMKLPVKISDKSQGLVGNTKIQALRDLAGNRLTHLLDCGSKSTGLNAETYRISFVLLALLDSVDAGHTKIRVGFTAGAEPPGGSARDAVNCSSSGVLEQQLIDRAKLHLR